MNAVDIMNDLEARAGASDQDRELWLANRRQGITATEVRDLAIGAKTVRGLIDVKLERVPEPDLSHIPVIAWGKAREIVIAGVLAGEGITPESRVFHHPENTRYLASPDGVAVDFDDQLVVSEIKTAAYDIAPGSPVMKRKGYELQCQWVMFVLGAQRCRYVVEERIEVARDTFEPGALHRHWIERDDAVIADLIVIAEAFLAARDAFEAEGAAGIDEVVDTHAVNYLRAMDEIKRWTPIKEESYAAIVAAGVSQRSALANVSYSPAKPGEVTEVVEFDEESAKAARGDLWAKVHGARQRAASAEALWQEHLQGFKTTRTVVGRGKPAGARITPAKDTKAVAE